MTDEVNEPISPQGVSEETLRLFEFISDPKNKHLFTVEASIEAFKHVKVKGEDETN